MGARICIVGAHVAQTSSIGHLWITCLSHLSPPPPSAPILSIISQQLVDDYVNEYHVICDLSEHYYVANLPRGFLPGDKLTFLAIIITYC